MCRPVRPPLSFFVTDELQVVVLQCSTSNFVVASKRSGTRGGGTSTLRVRRGGREVRRQKQAPEVSPYIYLPVDTNILKCLFNLFLRDVRLAADGTRLIELGQPCLV